MTLIKSISGIRGTIGGKPEENLTPVDTVKFAAAYGTYIQRNSTIDQLTIVVGRDARISGEMIQGLVMHQLPLPIPCCRQYPDTSSISSISSSIIISSSISHSNQVKETLTTFSTALLAAMTVQVWRL